MLGMGVSELLLICLIIFIFFGPEQLPTIVKTIAKIISEFRKESEEMKLIFMGIKKQDMLHFKEDSEVGTHNNVDARSGDSNG